MMVRTTDNATDATSATSAPTSDDEDDDERVPLHEDYAFREDSPTNHHDLPHLHPSPASNSKWGVGLLIIGFVIIGLHVYIFQTADTSREDPDMGFLSTIAESIQDESLETIATLPTRVPNATVLQLRAHPPLLSSLIIRGRAAHDNVPEKIGRVIGEVDWMMDFAIIGFAKCGTSFVKSWLNTSNQVHLDPREVAGLSTNKPVSVVNVLYKALQKFDPPKTNRMGIKFPGDVDSETALDLYRTLFPSTNMIVLLRHPILWFQSFYNFRYRAVVHSKQKRFDAEANTTTANEFSYDTSTVMMHPNDLIGSCWKHSKSDYRCLKQPGCDTQKLSVCTNRAQYHHGLSRLGLTPLNTDHEWDLLDHHSMTIDPTSSKVFLMELNQLHTPDEEKREQLRVDLQSFLGLEDDDNNALPPIPQYDTPPYHRVEGEIDICEAQYARVRKVLLSHGQRSSEWIQQYLMKSSRLVVSSRPYLLELLETYKTDPCAKG